MADLRDQFSEKEKDLSHLTPSAKPRPDAPKRDPQLPSSQMSPGRTNYVQPQAELPPSDEPPQGEGGGETAPQLTGSSSSRQPSGSERLRSLRAERGRDRGRETAEHRLGKRSAAGSLKKQIARRGIMAGCAAVAAEGVVVGIIAIMLFAAALSFTGDTAQAGTCGVGSGSAGISVSISPADPDGYTALPDSPSYVRSSPAAQQRGLPQLVKTIVIVSDQWSQKHPSPKLVIGDLNAPGHLSHKDGRDVDITSTGGIMMTEAGYSREYAIELGKIFIDQGNIELIFYNDPAVQGAVNAYARSKNLPGKMEYWPNHENHFHVRINGSEPSGQVSSADPADCFGASSGVLYTDELSEQQLRQIFGPPAREATQNLVSVDFLGSSVQVHKKVAPSLRAVAAEIKSRGITYRPEASRGGIGCYRPKDDGQIGDRSYHVYGAACDLNAKTNNYYKSKRVPYNPTCPPGAGAIESAKCYDMPPEVVEIFAKYGFEWGGKWTSIVDYMHFEWHGVKLSGVK